MPHEFYISCINIMMVSYMKIISIAENIRNVLNSSYNLLSLILQFSSFLTAVSGVFKYFLSPFKCFNVWILKEKQNYCNILLSLFKSFLNCNYHLFLFLLFHSHSSFSYSYFNFLLFLLECHFCCICPT